MDFRQKASARFAGVGSTLWWTVSEPACSLGVLAQTGETEPSSKILGQQYFSVVFWWQRARSHILAGTG